MKYEFRIVDVFTNRQFGGNPLAVVLDAEGLSSAQMQSIAGEFNLAETTFVLRPKDPGNSAHVRIFTPRAEMPFAGHPNVGTAFALAREGHVYDQPIEARSLLFEEIAGLVKMELLGDGSAASGAQLSAPQPLIIGDEVSPEVIAQVCNISVADVDIQNHRPCIASCGAPFAIAELRSREALAAAHHNAAAFTTHLPRDYATGVHVYMRVGGEIVDIHTRMFAPLHGIPEDPATGSANVALIGLLAQLGSEGSGTLSKRIGQGFDMGRPSIMDAQAIKQNGKVVQTLIGGECVEVMRGVLELR
jgi:trans-2,3-dihydro-3-hydroxyanthranilate isomerase